MNRKIVLFIVLVAFSCTSLYGQEYVISLVHGDHDGSKGVHEHTYQNWNQLASAKVSAASCHHLGKCEHRNCFMSVNEDHADIYSYKVINELPVTTVLLDKLELIHNGFKPGKLITPPDASWLFDFAARIERPPTYIFS